MVGALQVARNLNWSETARRGPKGLLEHLPLLELFVFAQGRIDRLRWSAALLEREEDCQFGLGRRWGRMDPARVKHSMVWNFFTPLESDNGDGAGTSPPPPAATGGSAAAASGGR